MDGIDCNPSQTDPVSFSGSLNKSGNTGSSSSTNNASEYENSRLELYKSTFGEMLSNQQPDKQISACLLRYAEQQPDATVDHNSYQAPSSRLERWKWMLGFENSLDGLVQKNYNDHISVLEGIQATSITQLKNQMVAFWHTDRQLKDYEQFKGDAKVQATSGLISRVFFSVLGFLFKYIYNPSAVLCIGKRIGVRSRETFAKIGGFEVDNKKYGVVAYQCVNEK